MGKPFLYKREGGYYPDEDSHLESENSAKWFLLFATKNDWRNDSDFNGIKQGLEWIVQNYHQLGIKSLALPALGCGLGRLNWSDVGPVMCNELSKIGIPVAIYLPQERSTPDEYKTEQFLMSR